jgi:tRNA-dihydrouridine synthase C
MIRGERSSALAWSDMHRLLHHFWRSVELKVSARHRNGRIKQWLHYLGRDYAEAQHQFERIRRLTEPDEITRALFANA